MEKLSPSEKATPSKPPADRFTKATARATGMNERKIKVHLSHPGENPSTGIICTSRFRWTSRPRRSSLVLVINHGDTDMAKPTTTIETIMATPLGLLTAEQIVAFIRSNVLTRGIFADEFARQERKGHQVSGRQDVSSASTLARRRVDKIADHRRDLEAAVRATPKLAETQIASATRIHA